MSTDFADAAARHWADGEFLHHDRRWPNADQLFGLAAECSLKAVMEALGMPMKKGTPASEKHKVHVDKLWDEFKTFSGDQGAAQYAALLSSGNPYGGWGVHQRYWRSSAIEEQAAEDHRRAAGLAMKVLERARSDGRIP